MGYFADGLTLGHGDKALVHGFRMDARDGGHVLIRGASGSGKTTLLMALAGLRLPLAGKVWLGSTELTALAPRELEQVRGRRMGIVFQQPHLMPSLNVMRNILSVEFAAGACVDEGRAMRLLKQVGMAGYEGAMLHALSHGQQQRVAIVRALAAKPDVVLADEPTAGLDDAAADMVADVLLAAKVQLVVATHDARLVKRLGKTVRHTVTMGGK